jgi:N-dimethylarginine dimethylaminohydrolase
MVVNCRSESSPLRNVLVRHPSTAFKSQRIVDANWVRYGYTDCPDFLQACRDFDSLVKVLDVAGAGVHLMDDEVDAGIDSIYVHDPALTIGSGIVLGRMGKAERRIETEAFETYCRKHDIPILGQIQEPGLLEGGDVTWIDDRTLAVGHGYRTNAEGIRQLQAICNAALPGVVHEIVTVTLPHFRGPGDVLHLMSLISPLAEKTAIVFKKLLPVPFLEELEERDFKLIDVPEDEYDLLGCNVLAVSPTTSVLAASAPATRTKLEREGFEVLVYPAHEISLKGQGGPTCLTRPLVRD